MEIPLALFFYNHYIIYLFLALGLKQSSALSLAGIRQKPEARLSAFAVYNNLISPLLFKLLLYPVR
jgi:hypothetical protein